MAAWVVTGCDTEPHSPTRRRKLKTNRMILSSAFGKLQSHPHLHTCQSRTCSTHFVMSSSAAALPIPGSSSCPSSRTKCCHAAISAELPLHSQSKGPGVRSHPLIQNGLARTFPTLARRMARVRWVTLQSVSWEPGRGSVSESAQARSVCVQHRSEGRCTTVCL